MQATEREEEKECSLIVTHRETIVNFNTIVIFLRKLVKICVNDVVNLIVFGSNLEKC